MKRLFLAFVGIVLTLMTYGQTISGSFVGLAQEGKAKFEIDFSEASIHGMSEEDFAVYEEDWYKDQPKVVADFLSEVADRLSGMLRLGSHLKTDYRLRVVVTSINSRGDFVCDLYVMNGEQVEASIRHITAKGGMLGTKLNLIKDGAEHTGKVTGNLLNRELKRANRKIKKNEPKYESA